VEGLAVVALEPRHAAIAPRIRQADRDEILASCGLPPAMGIAMSIAASEIGWAAELLGETVAVFGACRAGDGSGVPWLIATDEIERHPVHFYRMSRVFIGEIKSRFGYLENWVDARNRLSLRWLAWAGFAVREPEPWGRGGMSFRRIHWPPGGDGGHRACAR
jgi:hypothetical protein